jgi:hypothetical protein
LLKSAGFAERLDPDCLASWHDGFVEFSLAVM